MAEATWAAHLRESLLKGTFTGAIILGVIFALLFGFTGLSLFGLSGIWGFIVGALSGIAVGGAIGFIFSMMPPEVSSAVFTVLMIAALVGLGFLVFSWSKAGVFQVLISPLGFDLEVIMAGIQKGVACVRDITECLFKEFYDWGEPTLAETLEEVAVNVDFLNTKTLFFEGEDIVISSAVVVHNPYHPFYTIEPKCFLDGEEMEIRDTPRVDGGIIDFRKSDIEQRVSVICEKKGGVALNESEKQELKSLDFELHLVRNVIVRTEWNVYTLNRDVLERKENPFESVNEPNLRGFIVLSKMLFDSPLKLSIGSDNDQPFYEERWPFSVVLRNRDVPGELLGIRELVLEDVASRNIRIAQPCQFDMGVGTYSLSSENLRKTTDYLNKGDSSVAIYCTLLVQGLNPQKQVPEKTVIRAKAEFDFESIFKRPITILSGIERQELE